MFRFSGARTRAQHVKDHMKKPVMVDVTKIVHPNAVELARGIQSRRWLCREVMQAFLLHIHRFNPKVNVILSMVEPELLLAEADERDVQLQSV